MVTLFETDDRDHEAEAVMAALAGPQGGATSRLVEWAIGTAGSYGLSAEQIHERIQKRRSLGSVRIVLAGLAEVHDPAGRRAIEVTTIGRRRHYRPGPGWAPPHAGIFAGGRG